MNAALPIRRFTSAPPESVAAALERAEHVAEVEPASPRMREPAKPMQPITLYRCVCGLLTAKDTLCVRCSASPAVRYLTRPPRPPTRERIRAGVIAFAVFGAVMTVTGLWLEKAERDREQERAWSPSLRSATLPARDAKP